MAEQSSSDTPRIQPPEEVETAFDNEATTLTEDEPAERSDVSVGAVTEIEWRASEYIHHEKGSLWFIALGGVTLVATVLAAYFGQWIFAILIVVMGAALGFFAKRPPREVPYRITSEAVIIGDRTFPFTQFRAFGVLSEGAFYSVQLQPAKRFMPGVAVYFAEADGEMIFDALAAHLPMEPMSQDPVDRFMRWLRF